MVGARTIIVGASSGIGEALAQRLAERGDRLVLVARRGHKLQAICGRLDAGDGAEAHWLEHDVGRVEDIEGAFERAVELLGGMDLLIYAAGIMPPDLEGRYDATVEAEVVRINAAGAVAWLSLGADHLSRQGHGTLVGIGSIAGDRGRWGFPSYCASKAALHAYLEGLRNRLAGSGVGVLTIKPGPIATPMTEGRSGVRGLAPLGPSADAMMRAIERGRGTVYIPGRWRWVALALHHIPSLLFQRLRL
jgi:NAD(P)-dependent dehydrogenase (short-subunit alcohol dehydrogenase family)